MITKGRDKTPPFFVVRNRAKNKGKTCSACCLSCRLLVVPASVRLPCVCSRLAAPLPACAVWRGLSVVHACVRSWGRFRASVGVRFDGVREAISPPVNLYEFSTCSSEAQKYTEYKYGIGAPDFVLGFYYACKAQKGASEAFCYRVRVSAT